MAISEGQDDLVEKTVAQVRKEFMPRLPVDKPVGPLGVHAFFPPAFAGFWAIMRETTISEGQLARAEKEQIAAFVSVTNECKFCTFGHANFAIAAGADGDAVRKAVASANPELLATPKMRKICGWVKNFQKKKNSELNEAPPFGLVETPEVIGTAYMFNYINRVVDGYVSDGIVPKVVPRPVRALLAVLPFLRRPLMSIIFKMVGKHMKGAGPVKQGESLEIVSPDGELPEAFRWTRSNPSISKAFAYWSGAMDQLAKKYIPNEVTDFVGQYIEQNYTGEDPPISRNWVFKVAEESGLSEPHQVAVRYMLLMSFARFQIDGAITGDLNKHFPDDKAQRAMGMWAAHHTAKGISKWGGEAALKHLRA